MIILPLKSLLNAKKPVLLGQAFCGFNRWHLPTLPLMTAVPSAVRGLTTLFEMEEVNTRLNYTNLIDSFDQ